MPLGQARAAITDAELSVGQESVVEDPAPKNVVIDQDPASGGQTDKNAPVNLTVSSGPPQIVVPDVRDVPASDAQASLEAEGLVVVTREAHNANVAAGNAVKSEPAAGEPVDVGAEVTLTISKGPKPAVVPEVVGSKRGAANTAITDAGLVVGTEDRVQNAAEANTVINQDPAGGTELPTGSTVNLVLSSGPPTGEVPEVSDAPAAEAQATLEGLGFVVETQERTNANVAAGNAVRTEPAAGEVADVGSTVVLTISKGPKTAPVPDVVGSGRGRAEADITDAKLAVGTVNVADSNEAQGTVLSQDPAPGTEVPEGTSVNLTVSAGPPQVEIPEVKNSSQARATSDLEKLGLVVETQERSNSNVAAGDAVKTEPPAGDHGRRRFRRRADRQQGPQAGRGAEHRRRRSGPGASRHHRRRADRRYHHPGRGRRGGGHGRQPGVLPMARSWTRTAP